MPTDLISIGILILVGALGAALGPVISSLTVRTWKWIAARPSLVAKSMSAVVALLTVLTSLYSGFLWIHTFVFDAVADVVAQAELPRGAVIAYDFSEGCPSGWSLLPGGEGRFIVGTGRGYSHRQAGGQEMVSLRIEQIPEHSHDVRQGWSINENGFALSPDLYDEPPWATRLRILTTEPTGSSQAHENRPPYLALHWCRKD